MEQKSASVTAKRTTLDASQGQSHEVVNNEARSYSTSSAKNFHAKPFQNETSGGDMPKWLIHLVDLACCSGKCFLVMQSNENKHILLVCL